MARRMNPGWHSTPIPQRHSSFAANTNSLDIYLEIRQMNGVYEVHTWDGRKLGAFATAKEAEICARAFRTPLMPTSAIQDVRFVPDPALTPPKPKKHEKAVMNPIPVSDAETEFTPIIEDEEVVVAHPEDVIVF